jgi:hypothetical protein
MPCLWLLYQFHEEEWYVYHSDLSRYVWLLHQYHKEELYIYSSDLSCYVSDCTVSVSLRRVISLSQWFIMLCLWLYCISITKKSDKSFTVSYHAMSQTTVSVSLRRGIRISQWFIILCLTTVSVSLGSVICLTVIYHAMSLTVLYQYH